MTRVLVFLKKKKRGCACTHRRRLSARFTGLASFRFRSTHTKYRTQARATCTRCKHFFFDEPQQLVVWIRGGRHFDTPGATQHTTRSAVFSFRRTQRTLKDFEQHDTRTSHACFAHSNVDNARPSPLQTCFSTTLLDRQYPETPGSPTHNKPGRTHCTHSSSFFFFLSRRADSGSRCIKKKKSECARVRQVARRKAKRGRKQSGRSRSGGDVSTESKPSHKERKRSELGTTLTLTLSGIRFISERFVSVQDKAKRVLHVLRARPFFFCI